MLFNVIHPQKRVGQPLPEVASSATPPAIEGLKRNSSYEGCDIGVIYLAPRPIHAQITF